MPKQKTTTQPPAAGEQKPALVVYTEGVQQIGASPYFILPDGTVARRLKPTLINGVAHYNLCIGKAGKTIRTRHDRLQDFAKAFSDLAAAAQAKA
jgi:hypothetical protein